MSTLRCLGMAGLLVLSLLFAGSGVLATFN